jgi:hypothetical protein
VRFQENRIHAVDADHDHPFPGGPCGAVRAGRREEGYGDEGN